LVGKYERKRPLSKPWHRYEYNIEMDLKWIGWEGISWIHLAEYRDRWF